MLNSLPKTNCDDDDHDYDDHDHDDDLDHEVFNGNDCHDPKTRFSPRNIPLPNRRQWYMIITLSFDRSAQTSPVHLKTKRKQDDVPTGFFFQHYYFQIIL